MLKFNRLKLGVRLFFGFAVVVFFTIFFGFYVLVQQNSLAQYTRDIHNHPMVVSNAVREIKIDLLKIQNNLHLMIHDSDFMVIDSLIISTHDLESQIDQNFKLIQDRFLGDMEDVDRAYASFREISPVFNDILVMVRQDQAGMAAELNTQLSRIQMDLLLNQVDLMSGFAAGKSEEFFQNAVTAAKSSYNITIGFLFLLVLFSIFIAGFISMSLTRRLKKLIGHVGRLSVGDLEEEIFDHDSDEIGTLIGVISGMQRNLREVADHAGKISKGDYSGKIELRSVKDELSRALNTMTVSLDELKSDNLHRDWVKSGVNLVSRISSGEKSLQDLADGILFGLAEYIEAAVGAFYLYNSEKGELVMFSSYAYSRRKDQSDVFHLGEGLAGQAGLERKTISILDVPEDYLTVSSGLGEKSPASVIAVPLVGSSDLKGVLEFGIFREWTDRERELFDSVSENIAVSINSCQDRGAMQKLLEKQALQAQELMSQQEALRATNEELEEKTESLLLSEDRLKQQQEELQAANEELEEKTDFLENQRDEINAKNRELEVVKDEILKKARDLEVSSRYKSEFLANMSHELRTPLNSLLILARDLAGNKGERLSEDDVKSAEIIYSSGNELLRLINEVLDLAKIESGKMDMDQEDVLLDGLSEEIRQHFEGTAREKGLSLLSRLEEGGPASIRTDKQKLMQILRNLLSNALKFTREGSVSLIISAAGRGRVNFRVEDTGIGISGDEQERIFEAFRQVDGSVSREFGGTGLGLSISRELAGLLNGYIKLESEPGRGSVFTLNLPASPSEASNPVDIRPLSAERAPESGRKPPVPLAAAPVEDDRDSIAIGDRIILIVEDDAVFCSILCDMAREEGFKAVAAGSGEEGLALVQEFNPQAVILDIKLPGMSGLQVLDQLKTGSPTRHIPVHVISGDDRSADVLDRGVIGFLQKPIDDQKLKGLFEQLTGIIEKTVKDLLIVEDDENLRFAIEKLIGNHDVLKTSVATGEEALRELALKKFDCMVLDLNLPDMSGGELLEAMEKMEDFPKPPVIIYTGREISYEEEFELRRYASSIIIKGVNSQERLLDETSLFLHRVIRNMPDKKQEMISRIYDEETIFKEKQILIVDDDMRNVYALSRILEERGMKALKAANGRKAMEMIGAPDFSADLILMDIMMPEMDGYETMREIRKIDKYRNLPILALTAKAMKEDRHKCLEAGANDYMTKPIDEERLLSLMRVWLYK